MSDSGLAVSVKIDDAAGVLRDISADVASVSFETPRSLQKVTGVGAIGVERIVLRADGRITLTGLFNDAPNMSHAVLSSVGTASVVRSVEIAVAGQTLSMEMCLAEYDVRRGPDGALVWTATAQLSDVNAPAWT